MLRRTARLLPLLIALQLPCFPVAAAETPPPPGEKCPVCGMFVAKYTDWLGMITIKGAKPVYFDGPKDLFTFYLNMGKYRPGTHPANITAVQVRDYYTLKSIDGRKAFFVSGSDVYGPMGKELVPFANEADARAFLQDHKGKRILRFGDITPAVLKTLE